jgi:hypothetical protein
MHLLLDCSCKRLHRVLRFSSVVYMMSLRGDDESRSQVEEEGGEEEEGYEEEE